MKESYKRLKSQEALSGKSTKDLTLEDNNTAVCQNMPNDETRQVIEEIESGEGLKKATDSDELFDKLGI